MKRHGIKRGLTLAAIGAVVSALFVAVGPTAGPATAEVPVAVANPSFESALVGGAIPGWTQPYGSFALSSDASDGTTSVELIDASATSAAGLLSAPVAVTPSHNYRLVVDARRIDTIGNVYMRYFDANNALISSSVATLSGGVGVWSTTTLAFTPPAGTVTASVLLYIGVAPVGSIRFDDVRILDDGLIRNSGFETPLAGGMIPGWSVAYGVIGDFQTSGAQKLTGSASLRMVDGSATAASGLISDAVAVTAGDPLRVTAGVFRVAGAPSLFVRFYNAAGAQLSNQSVGYATVPNSWDDLAIDVVAPATAVSLRVLLYSGSTTITEAFFDDVTVAPQLTEETSAGTPLYTVNSAISEVTTTSGGDQVAYVASYGSPARISQIDAVTGELLQSSTLPGSGGAWGLAVGPDDSVYIGGLSSGQLYRWVPGSGSAVQLGAPVTGETYINALSVDQATGVVYGGTFPNGRLFAYDPALDAVGTFASAVTDYGQAISGASYVRSVEVAGSKVFAGTATNAGLAVLDIPSQTITPIALPTELTGSAFAYGLTAAGGYLFVRAETPGKAAAMKLDTGAWTVLGDSLGLFASPANDDGEVYLLGDDNATLLVFDTVTATTTTVALPEDVMNMRKPGWIEVAGDADFPGQTLSWVSTVGRLHHFNPTTGELRILETEVAQEPATIHDLSATPDGDVLLTKFVAGGVSSYDPDTASLTNYASKVGQVEGWVHDGSTTWMSSYTKSSIWEFDRAAAVTSSNPKKLFDLESAGQDRPMALTGLADGRLAVGTVPVYGALGGAIAVFDPSTSPVVPTVYPAPVADHSVVALTSRRESGSDYLYVGTSIDGGLGSVPTAASGVVSKVDADDGSVVWSVAPIAGERAFPDVTIGSNGNLWAIGTGTLVELDPATGATLRTLQIAPVSTAVTWIGSSVISDGAGKLFVHAGKRLFAVSESDLDVYTVATGVDVVATDFANDRVWVGRNTKLSWVDISAL